MLAATPTGSDWARGGRNFGLKGELINQIDLPEKTCNFRAG
jgi:hypothetical protein